MIAYRHTKADLFAEKSIPSRLELLEYEKDLLENLKRLLQRIQSGIGPNGNNWTDDEAFLGHILHQPKAVEPNPEDADSSKSVRAHFYITDAKARWESFKEVHRPSASFRTMAVPSIDFQVLSMLWIMKVGHLLDQHLLPCCRANRLKRCRDFGNENNDEDPPLNNDAPQVFRPYYFAYRNWRRDGLKAIEKELDNKNRVVAVTMDLQRYYHQIDPAVLANQGFWNDLFGIKLDVEQSHLTGLLTHALVAWAAKSPDKMGIPVGLLASKIISNALLHGFDKAVSERINPVFYARYVDDILIVIRPSLKTRTAAEIMNGIKLQLGKSQHGDDLAEFKKGCETTMILKLPNVGKSVLEFGASKQRIFDFQGASGKDLLDTINHEIDELSSEFRLMPDVPEDDGSVLKQALVADHDLELGADSLRKADSLTIRRLGLAILLRNHEMLERCMADPKEWKTIRTNFYNLIEEHVLTPERYGTFFQYLPRIVGLIAANGDWRVGEQMLKRVEWVQSEIEILPNKIDSNDCGKAMLSKLLLDAVAASFNKPKSAKEISFRRFRETFNRVFEGEGLYQLPDADDLDRDHKNLAQTDLDRLGERARVQTGRILEASERTKAAWEELATAVPRLHALTNLNNLLSKITLNSRSAWRFFFATRPLGTIEINQLDPKTQLDLSSLGQWLRCLRGNYTQSVASKSVTNDNPWVIRWSGSPDKPLVAITSYKTKPYSWSRRVMGTPDLSRKRFDQLAKLVRSISQLVPRPHYVVFPELSIPREWIMEIASSLQRSKISLIAGVEYQIDLLDNHRKCYNSVFMVLRSTDLGYTTFRLLRQDKTIPALEEVDNLLKMSNLELVPQAPFDFGYLESHKNPRPVFQHGNFQFGVLICNEMTNIAFRSSYRGRVDALFAVEWNKDLKTFAPLVEATANDVHCFVIQVNNGEYGDSRIRIPAKDDWKRDVVRLQGGENDYAVVGELNVPGLRMFQSHHYSDTDQSANFKPVPTGFSISASRSKNPLLHDEK